jgi:hypothetical protein
MTNRNRDLLLLLKADNCSGKAFEQQVDELHKVLFEVECNDALCTAHELVTRTRVTSKKSKILDAISGTELKPFYFLINKN